MSDNLLKNSCGCATSQENCACGSACTCGSECNCGDNCQCGSK